MGREWPCSGAFLSVAGRVDPEESTDAKTGAKGTKTTVYTHIFRGARRKVVQQPPAGSFVLWVLSNDHG